MATGQTLGSTVELLKEKIDDSLSVGTANDARYQLAIEKKQMVLATEFDWACLQDYWDSTVNARYNDVPTVDYTGTTKLINFDRRPDLYTLYSTRYQPVDFGIGVTEWNLFNPDLGYTQDPIQRWRFKPDDYTKYEVWPVPATFPQTLRFVGWRQLNTLRTNGSLDTSKTLELDDRLVAYSVAMDMQVDKLAPSAVNIQRELAFILSSLRGNDESRPQQIHLGHPNAYWANPRRRLVGAKIIVTA